MAELVDAPDLGSGAERCGGSSPPFRTNRNFGIHRVVPKSIKQTEISTWLSFKGFIAIKKSCFVFNQNN